jgi:hypothetical protein
MVFDTLGISLNIKPYDTISSSQKIVLNNNNNIDWGVFEGEGGILKLYDENENFSIPNQWLQISLLLPTK